MKIEYSADGNVAIYCGYKFRRDPKTGYYLCTKKTDAGRRERLHVFVWRKNNGDIPKGYHIHHIDEDKRNNELENLACIPQFDHLSIHAQEHAENNHEAICKNLVENAIPKANEWHRSEAGRAWHSEHGKRVTENLAEKQYVCESCGKVFYKKPLGGVKYCSNACKTKARYRSGADNEERKCPVCGRAYIANKYTTSKTCSRSCGRILYFREKHKSDRESACV